MKKSRSTYVVLLLLAVNCSCSLQNKFVQTELYFGLSKTGGGMVSDSVWTGFVRNEITNVFPEGFTVIRAEGQWLDKQVNKIYTEPSYIVTHTGKMTVLKSAQIDSLRERYKSRFHQQSVLRTDKKIKLDF